MKNSYNSTAKQKQKQKKQNKQMKKINSPKEKWTKDLNRNFPRRIRERRTGT